MGDGFGSHGEEEKVKGNAVIEAGFVAKVGGELAVMQTMNGYT